MQSLDTHLKNRSLVSVQRRAVDGYGIQGFLVGISDLLVALEYVYDFQIDGLMFLRRSEISAIRRTATDEFQESLLDLEGVRAGSQGPIPTELEGWQSLLEQLNGRYPFMILERELGPSPNFSIGRLTKIAQAQVEIQPFSGAGTFSARPRRLKYSQITSIQVNTRYLGFYQRYFARNAAQPLIQAHAFGAA